MPAPIHSQPTQPVIDSDPSSPDPPPLGPSSPLSPSSVPNLPVDSTTTTPAEDSGQAKRKPGLRHKRSVKFIVSQYELSKDPYPASTSSLSVPSSSSNSSVNSYGRWSPSQSPSGGATLQQLTPSPSSFGHNRQSSVLLASPSYPSTFKQAYSRSQTLSISSQSLSSSLCRPSSPSASHYRSNSPRIAEETTITMSSTDAHKQPVTAEEDDSLYEEMDSVADLGGNNSLSVNGNGDPEVDLSKMTAAERRQHSRKHSKVHAKNLSVFFPRPGSEAELEADQIKASKHFASMPQGLQPSTPLQSPALGHRRNGSGNRPQTIVSTDPNTLSPKSASFAQAQQAQSSGLSASSYVTAGADLSPSSTRGRRGHHHKHSVSHAASGLSPASASMGGVTMSHSSSAGSYMSDGSLPTPGALTPRREGSYPFAFAAGDNHDKGFVALKCKPASMSASTIDFLSQLPPSSRPLFFFGLAHFALGASLWVAGQAADSLAATGLGYLVVFDSMGVLSGVVADWSAATSTQQESGKLRKPYGTHRLPTLLHFVQTIYLLFSSVYVLKESVEHALLEGGGGGGSEGVSGHDHSHVHEEHSSGLEMPTTLLFFSLAFCVISNVLLGNHSKLVAACGISTAASTRPEGRHGRSGSVLVHPSALASPLLVLLANPFSLTVLFFCTTLLFAGLTMPPLQVAALDKVLAGLESVSMFYVAYPASVALGKVLLQTAPSSSVPQKTQLLRALKGVEDHPMVSYIPPPQLWQLTPPTSSVRQGTSGGVLGRGTNQGAKSASLIASVTVYLKNDTTEEDVFEMTKWVWERVAPSVGAGRGLVAGEMLRGTLRAGELTVVCKRERREEEGIEHDAVYESHHHHHGHDHHGHDHSHGHARSHGHDHSHEHGHDHSHGHDHDHSHDHDHGHNHAHGQDHTHGRSHDHGHGKDCNGHFHSHTHSPLHHHTPSPTPSPYNHHSHSYSPSHTITLST